MDNQHLIKMGKNDNEERGNSIIDMNILININTYNDNKRDVNNKFEKILLVFEDSKVLNFQKLK